MYKVFKEIKIYNILYIIYTESFQQKTFKIPQWYLVI